MNNTKFKTFLERVLSFEEIPENQWNEIIEDIVEIISSSKVKTETVQNLFLRLKKLTEERATYCLNNSSKDPLLMLDLRKVVDEIDQTCSVWLHDGVLKDIVIAPGANHHIFFTEKIVWDEKTLVVLAENLIQLRFDSDPLILRYMEICLEDYKGKTEHEVMHGIQVPVNIDNFKEKVADTLNKYKLVTDEIENIVKLAKGIFN